MDFLKPDAIYLVAILIMPGLLSQSVFNYLVEQGKAHTLDIYQGLIHSFYIYIFLYPIYLWIWKTPKYTAFVAWFISSPTAPVRIALVLVLTSIIWGYLRVVFYQNEGLERLFARFRGVEPPNLYAAILDSQYAETPYGDNDRVWITARMNDMTAVGSLYRYSLSQPSREIELQNVVYYALDGTITELPVDTSVIIRVDDADIIEIRHVTEE